MSEQQNLSAVAGNDILWHVTLTYNGEPLPAGSTPTAYLKALATTPDEDAIVFTIGDGLTWTFESFGKLDWVIPRADTVPAGSLWYRIDVENASEAIGSALLGTVTLMAA